MFLRNLLPHKKGTRILMDGIVYLINQEAVLCDEKGVPYDLSEAGASRFLKNKDAWTVNGAPTPRIEHKAPKGAIKLITSTGEILPPPETPKTVPGAKLAQPKSVLNGSIPPPPDDSKQVEFKDPPIPKKGEDWADPSLSCSLEWLQACAKAYKVKSKGKSKEKILVALKAAMYE